MKIADCFICWTPVAEKYPSGFRGKIRLFQAGTAHVDMAPFACKAGRFDARAQDPRPEIRQAYVLMIALMMSERDGLNVASVHRFFLEHIDEYAAACAPELLEEATP
jgi:hypothetical protein